MRKLIATRGRVKAYAESEDFDPLKDNVTVEAPGEPPRRVLWQTALKFGYWDEA